MGLQVSNDDAIIGGGSPGAQTPAGMAGQPACDAQAAEGFVRSDEVAQPAFVDLHSSRWSDVPVLFFFLVFLAVIPECVQSIRRGVRYLMTRANANAIKRP